MIDGQQTVTPSPQGGEGRDEGSSGPNTKPAGKIRQARHLRANQTKAEQVFWNAVRNRRLRNFKFTRQLPIRKYTVDFVCRLRRLVVEIDGGQHDRRKADDDRRTAVIEARGYRVVRYWNAEILDNLDGVLADLLSQLGNAPGPDGPPLIPAFSPLGRRGGRNPPR